LYSIFISVYMKTKT